ncbi:MAG: MaoC family dehydratase N-terminal domain-containing protein [Alcanivoracaceae bacterium]|jgi:acyl dehydratase|nr:MaoC family dehydratase N-terminal domain-containing protein [Alcanivoracaceae bacterium]
MIDKSHIGKKFPDHSIAVEAGRLRFFAEAIGETSPVYVDEAAAQAAGYHALPVPPTFMFGLEMERPDAMAWLMEIGMNLAKILHGEQTFTYHRPACAGDILTFDTCISDIYDKKNGALEFVVKQSRVTNQKGEHVADLKTVLVQRNS